MLNKLKIYIFMKLFYFLFGLIFIKFYKNKIKKFTDNNILNYQQINKNFYKNLKIIIK